jgi:LysR family transcriptional regulator for metE and metH
MRYPLSMHVTIPQLAMVDAICREGTVTGAARRLAVTQPALSHRLRELESQLDLKLFCREGLRMTVTREGERVARSARAVVDELARLKHDLTQLQSGYQGVLRLATECYTCYDWLPGALESFAVEFPGVEVQIVPEATREPVKRLLDGTLDLAMVYTRPDREDLTLTPLFRDELVAVVPRSHALAGRRHLTARDFRDECLVCHFPDLERNVFAREVLSPAGVTPRRVQAVQLTGAVLAMVAAGRGVTVIPRWVLGKEARSRDFVAVRVTPRGLFRVWYAAARREDARLPTLARLVDVLGREAPRAVGGNGARPAGGRRVSPSPRQST